MPIAAAYVPGSRMTFALAVSAIAATLAWLVFVAVSINLKRILEFPNLPARAAQTLILFATPLVNSRSPRSERETPLTWFVGRVFPAVASCGCLAIGGAASLAQAAGGLYWLVSSVLAAIIFGLVNAWVLLVEIQR